MIRMKNRLSYFNGFGKECPVDFKTHEYHNLMELLLDKYTEEWGDCRGRAWCGTCHTQIIEGTNSEKMEADEKQTLSKLIGRTSESRLACQIPVTSELSGLVIRIIGDM